jgi:hypothetical protein
VDPSVRPDTAPHLHSSFLQHSGMWTAFMLSSCDHSYLFSECLFAVRGMKMCPAGSSDIYVCSMCTLYTARTLAIGPVPLLYIYIYTHTYIYIYIYI